MGDPLDYVDRININTKNFPPVTHLIEVAPYKGERAVKICRCWQSKKFPYCDDTHKVLVEAGDNVGPFIATLKGANPDPVPRVDLVKNVAAKGFLKRNGFFAVTLCLSAVFGYQASSFLKQWAKSASHNPLLPTP